MESSSAVAALSALAQENRLDVFRLLVQTGPDGMAAGDVAERLEIPPATLSFHLAQLRQAGLLSMRRDGRSLIYSANYDGMNALMAFLTENCCRGAAPCAVPASVKAKAPRRKRAAQP
ncbi:MAG TPA: metalloregulator ArsR/SmtB family transcription factor [Reyranella sp.]|jgi:ArsR family transcriptional regulator